MDFEASKAPRIETPKVSKGCRMGEGVSPSLADYGVWGSVVSFPSWVRGRALAKNDFTAF